eukprot:5759109-Amphidinium_carterae.1
MPRIADVRHAYLYQQRVEVCHKLCDLRRAPTHVMSVWLSDIVRVDGVTVIICSKLVSHASIEGAVSDCAPT